jgi:hypothetical protein
MDVFLFAHCTARHLLLDYSLIPHMRVFFVHYKRNKCYQLESSLCSSSPVPFILFDLSSLDSCVVSQSSLIYFHFTTGILCRGKFGTLNNMDSWAVLDAFTSVSGKQSCCGTDKIRIC